jgi:hypothetical protein
MCDPLLKLFLPRKRLPRWYPYVAIFGAGFEIISPRYQGMPLRRLLFFPSD